MTLLAVVFRARPSVGRLLTLGALTVGLLCGAAVASAAPPARLTQVQVLDAPNATAIHLHLSGTPGSVTSEVVGKPGRLVVTLGGTENATGQTQIDAASPRAQRVLLEPVGGALRLTVIPGRAVDPFHDYGVSPTDVGLLLTVGVGELVLAPEQEAPKPSQPQAPPTPPAPKPTRAQAPAPPTPGPVTPTPPAPAPPPVAPPTPAPERGARPPEKPSPAPQEAAAPETPTPVETEVVEREPTRADGLPYPVGAIQVQYARIAPGQPNIHDLADIDVSLLHTPKGYVAPRRGVRSEKLPIARPAGMPAAIFYGSAIRAMNQAIVNEFNRLGLVGVLVRPHPDDIDPNSSRDLRPPGDTTLRLVVWTGHLIESRTFASGERVPEDQRIDNPVHERVKEDSPVKPGEILNKKALDAYVARLNRHPGRTVDVTLTKSLEPGGVYLDYLIAENKPWSAYVQGSDTGTKETTRWRERFGFVDNQTTGRDDILHLDYVTGDFQDVHAVFGSYELPLPIGPEERDVRMRLGGSWSQYDASEVGIQNAEFKGSQWTGGGQALVNIFQYHDLFIDLFGGGRYQHVTSKNQPLPAFPNFNTKGTANFLFGELGLQLERRSETSTVQLGVSGEANIPGLAGTRARDLSDLGRQQVEDKNVRVLRWNATTSFYLEPLFPSYEDPSTPSSSTLAHEIFLQGRGQLTRDRLIPYQQAVAGGLNTVRGYTQSLLASDNASFWRAEYRLHIPRLFPIRPTPVNVPLLGSFRVAPQQVYGRPDWDLVLRAFSDGAYLQNNKTVTGDFRNEYMASVGAGVELQLLTNFVGRVDYGYALTTAGEDRAGHDEVHLSFTIVY